MLFQTVLAGIQSLQSYIATHVLTCLVPAFLLAGAMVAFIDKEAVLDRFGPHVSKWKAFSGASVASLLLAACSCTVIPVAAGLFFAGAGVGVVFIVLWVAPSANILSLVYTGTILGTKMVVVRAGAALLMAVAVGWAMSFLFERQATVAPPAQSAAPRPIMDRKSMGLAGLILLSLLLPNYLVASGPYLYKVAVWGALTAVVVIYAATVLQRDAILAWLRESWWFVRTIVPLLLIGVFLVGVVGHLLPEAWVRQWLGGNGLAASFFATLIGSVSYFATMTEAPFVDTLMQLGMGKGPALALLLTGPGLSLPNWLAIAKVFGARKALAYVPMIIALGTVVGWVSGNLIF